MSQNKQNLLEELNNEMNSSNSLQQQPSALQQDQLNLIKFDSFDLQQQQMQRIDSGQYSPRSPQQQLNKLQFQKSYDSDSDDYDFNDSIDNNQGNNKKIKTEKLTILKRQELLDNEDAINVDAEVQQQMNQEQEEEKLGENHVNIHLDIVPKFKYIDAQIKSKQTMPMMIKLTSQMKDLKKEGSKSFQQRIPIDLVVIIDISGSMMGKKLNLVKDSLKYLLTILTENDRICLIQFQSSADILTPFKKCSSAYKQELSQIIDKIKSFGGTNITSGFESAIFMLKSRKFINKVTGVFLLSDGQDDQPEVAIRVQNLIKQSEINNNFKVNTFGYGNDHDAKQMTLISSQLQGNYYFIESLEKVDQYFVLSLSGLLTIVAENIEVKVVLEDRVDVTKTYGGQNLWKYNQIKNEYTIQENLLVGGVEKHYIFEIEISELGEKHIQLQHLPILKAMLKFQTVKSKIVKEQIESCQIKIVSQENQANDIDLQEYESEEVSIEHFRVLTAEKIGEAKTLAQQNQYDKAQELLDQMIMQLKFSKFSKDQVIEVLIKDINKIKNVCKPKIFQEQGEAFMLKKEQEHQLELALSCSLNYANDYQEELMEELQNYNNQ